MTKLTERQRALLQDFIDEQAFGESDWLSCSSEEYRTARSLEKRGLLKLYGAAPGVFFDAQLTGEGLKALSSVAVKEEGE